MSNQSSSNQILCASFNQDASLFAVATRDGIRIFNSNTGRLCYEKDMGAFVIVEMLFSTSLLAIVGAGEQPSLSPRRLCLFNTAKGSSLRELNFLTTVRAVRMNKTKLIVVLQDKTYIYDLNSLTILDTIDTVPNAKGLCAFSPSSDGCYLALPASTSRGSVLVYNVMELHSHCEIDAHRSPLVAMVFSSNGKCIATASEQGTIIRVHLLSDASQSYSYRRGTYPSTIFSLSFGLAMELPDILAATSSSGSIHVFSLGYAMDQSRTKKPTSFLGSMIPDSLSDAFDPNHHHVQQNVVPAGIKSYVMIRNVDKVTDTTTSEIVAYRVIISIIAYDGYFKEYGLTINSRNESSWSLDRDFNLVTAISDRAACPSSTSHNTQPLQ